MRLQDFEAMVRRMTAEIPAEFLEGIAEVVVSPRVVAHPDREGIWTMGECIPLPGDDGDPRHLQSRVVLYHGSFKALAQDTEKFNWVEETWETLTHEIRHHVEWKARADKLEAFDEAAESNFARMDRESFDPSFYKDGMRRQDGGWQVDDDVFFERVVRIPPEEVSLVWHGEDYVIRIPEDTGLPAFLTLTGLREPPPGEVILVLQKHGSWLEVFRKPRVYQAEVAARRLVQ